MGNYMILPKTNNQELLVKYYSLSDLFVICSKKENFPTTCVEAQCCGTPVVGFDTGGTRETSVIAQDDFVKYGDIEALKDVILNRLKNQPKGLAEKASHEYSKDEMVKKYISEYDKEGKKKRILLIDVNCKNTSTGKIVYDLYTNLRKDGRKVAVCYGRGERIDEEDIFKFGIDWETAIHAGLARITGYNGFFSAISTKRLIDYIEKFKPDLVHIHELHAYFVNIPALLTYLKKRKIKIIWTFHCEYMYTGKCGYVFDCEKYKSGCGNCPALKEYPKSLFFDKTKRMLQEKRRLLEDMDLLIVTPSEWLRERVKTSFLKNKQIKVIHNGIDTEVFHPFEAQDIKSELKIPSNKKVVLALAPNIMSERKGGKWVLKLAEKMKTEDVFFLIVGV